VKAPNLNEVFADLTVDMLVAQAFTFLTAGSEPACNTLTFALLELSRHPDIQDKARDEVRLLHGKYQAFTYDAVKEMTYLENCLLG
jgi:cytochrome P450 family 6